MSSSTSSLKQRLLDALLEGRLASEDVVDEALAADESVRARLTELAESATNKPVYRAHVLRRLELSEAEWADVIGQVRASLARHPDVLSVGFGRAFASGESEDLPAVVVRVRQKQAVPQDRRLPSSVTATLRDRPLSFRVDVQEQPVIAKQGDVRPGSACSVHGALSGTVSACIVGEANQHTVLLSGHVVRSKGDKVLFVTKDSRPIQGEITWHAESERMDAAAVSNVSDSDAIDLTEPAADVVTVLPHFEGLLVTIHGAATGTPVKAQIQDVSTDVIFENAGRMEDLIQLDRRASKRGDSGAPATDSRGRLVGFVVGTDRNGHTYLISARKVIDAVLL